MASRLIVAIDTADLGKAEALARAVSASCGMVKLGLEFFTAHGAPGVAAIAAASSRPVFLDLKLHDIPNTVAGAVTALAPLRPAFLTIHGQGGAAMITAARRAAEKAGGDKRPKIIAVTVLTSLDPAALHSTGVSGGPTQQALRLGRLAIDAGADGLVCGPREAAALRALLGPAPLLIVPGVRPAGTPANDQVRIATPEDAIEAGADWIVIGRPITQSADPAEACRRIAAETDAE
jgi:orotidine-5'-phosphate decarboxylase